MTEPPVETSTFELPGLTGPAEILVDKWGVPHITAGDRHDVFFVQGFNAARDRLWAARNTPGQSGDPRSPHYADLAPTWAARGYLPLVYSRAAVAAAASMRITLVPEQCFPPGKSGSGEAMPA